MSGPKACPRCGQKYPKGLAKKKWELRSARIRNSLAVRKSLGLPIGRPHMGRVKEAIDYRKAGKSIREIARIMQISTWAVRRRIYSDKESK